MGTGRATLSAEQIACIVRDTIETFTENENNISLTKGAKYWYRSALIWKKVMSKITKKGAVIITTPMWGEKIKAKITKIGVSRYHLGIKGIDRFYGGMTKTLAVLQNYIGRLYIKKYIENKYSSSTK